MADIRWTLQAEMILKPLLIMSRQTREQYAHLLAVNLLTAVERAALFPYSGRVVPETSISDIREILQGNYRIIYRVKHEAIEVLAIYHSARLLDPSRLQ